ncbi:MAG: CBS domain protein [uncultured Paraburkholderia sp.]|nr:MAG: CBS domain protein [uncultured Paraburkholderia sp.]CAH2933430.1 MAG: CBS domain protein [uncultured Paraburkholderia sp.]
MAEKGIGALVVTDANGIAGIVTERDYARKVVLMDRSSKATPVRDIMSRAVRFVRPDQTTDDCMALMTERRMRHLPVIENDRLVCMVSIGDLVKKYHRRTAVHHPATRVLHSRRRAALNRSDAFRNWLLRQLPYRAKSPIFKKVGRSYLSTAEVP